ncbi:MAG: DUF2784 domain-containing protein [Gammaproteobacteria bacterium]|nr:DUF2784 domain-containing protein [Gammaproteobacteria bacterium]
MTDQHWRLAADAVLIAHALFAAFVVLALPAIFVGAARGWRWVRNRALRIAHLVAIGVVIGSAWLGELCPLTVWENALRARAGDAAYPGAFLQHWLERLLYYDAPAWVFLAAYTVFGLLVVLTLILVPPRRW